jgi:hypothetical protein
MIANKKVLEKFSNRKSFLTYMLREPKLVRKVSSSNNLKFPDKYYFLKLTIKNYNMLPYKIKQLNWFLYGNHAYIQA